MENETQQALNLALAKLARELANEKPGPYANDPVAFVHDILHASPAPYQEEILAAIPREKRVSVRGPHGLGKSTMAAWAILWFIASFPDSKVPTTASAWRQLTKFLWPEVHKWALRAEWSKLNLNIRPKRELMDLSLRLAGREAFAVASDNPDLIEGAHAKHLLYVFDESKAIIDATWDAAEGAFSAGDCYAFSISTPGVRSGRFYDIQRRASGFEDWWVRHVTLDEAIRAKRISATWVAQRLKQWGEDSPVYQAKVLGEFPEQAENALISLAWIEAARDRELKPKGTSQIGVDVARFGDDYSAYFEWQSPCVMSGDTWQGNDLMNTTGRIIATGKHANVDEIGVGAGVVDRLNELGHPCTPVNVAAQAFDNEHFQNRRIEEYWRLRERFRSGQIDLTRLTRDQYDALSGQLTSLMYEYTSKGQLKLESKEEMKARIGRSPDDADALMLAQVESGEIEMEVSANREYSIGGGEY